MRSGKISEAILKRSVLKELRAANDNVVLGPGIGNDAAIVKSSGEMVTATTTVTLGDGFWGRIGIYRVMNDIASVGGRMNSVMMNITMPEKFDEKVLKDIIRQSERICCQNNLQITGGHTEISSAVVRPVVSYTGIGSRIHNVPRKVEPGQKIVLTKWIGMEGAYLAYQFKREELRARFNNQLLDFVLNTGQWLACQEEAEIAGANGVCYMHNLSNGGLFNGLWELAAFGGVGIKVDYKKIPVRQEIIEISEYFDINPYQMMSGGSMLMTIAPESDIVNILRENEIPAVVIGEVTDNNDKILVNEDEVRYMDVSKRDELWKVLNN